MHPLQKQGTLAQLVEQWTENPCVPGSIPGGTTDKPITEKLMGFLFYIIMCHWFPRRFGAGGTTDKPIAEKLMGFLFNLKKEKRPNSPDRSELPCSAVGGSRSEKEEKQPLLII